MWRTDCCGNISAASLRTHPHSEKKTQNDEEENKNEERRNLSLSLHLTLRMSFRHTNLQSGEVNDRMERPMSKEDIT